jgi:hypothetical protein
MSTKERLVAALDRLSETDLERLYAIAEEFATREPEPETKPEKKPGVLSKLKEIRIDAPKDYSRNFREYLYGDKKDVDLP